MRALDIVDSALATRAVVVGSLPPDGRDLDVLVRDAAEIARLERALWCAGFRPSDGTWLRFANMTTELVELIPATALRLRPAAEEALFADAIPVEGCERLARPAPPDALLLLARKAAATIPLTPRRIRRFEAALAEDPEAWQKAVARAPGWGAPALLDALSRYRSQPVDCGPHATTGLLPSGVRARMGAARDRARGRRRGAVIALSGLDGSGKSTQAHALADALERLGYDVAVEWTRIGVNERFGHVAAAFESRLAAALNIGRRVRRSARTSDAARVDRRVKLCRRSAVLTQFEATALAIENAWCQWRRISGFLARGYVVVCDRYTLDSIVSLRCLADVQRRFPVHRAFLRAATRRPMVAYLLDVTPETAWARKGEQGVERLRRQRLLYREEHRSLDVARLDGERAPDDLAAQIASEAWAALRRHRV
jgi:thymidylate kinase